VAEWLKKAKEFWNFTSSFTGFIDYKTLSEKKQDKFLLAFIKNLHIERYDDQASSIKKILDKAYSDLLQEQGSRRFDVMCRKMKSKVADEFNDILNSVTK